jgi:transposase
MAFIFMVFRAVSMYPSRRVALLSGTCSLYIAGKKFMRITAEMFPVVEDWLQSGLTQKEYSQRHQLALHILHYWAGKYRKEKTGPSKQVSSPSSGHFIPVSTDKEMISGMEVVLPTGVIIRFADQVLVN